MGNGGRNCATKARIFPASTSSEIAAISKSLRSNSPYSAAMSGNSSRHGSHQEAQKFTSVTRPAKWPSGTVSPPPPPPPPAGPGGGGRDPPRRARGRRGGGGGRGGRAGARGGARGAG